MSTRIAHVHEALPAVGDPEGGWNWASLPPSTKTRKRNWGAGQVMGRAGKCGRRGAIPQICSALQGGTFSPAGSCSDAALSWARGSVPHFLSIYC